MKRVNVNEIAPGMVLAREARGTNGRLLFNPGQVLEAAQVRVLNMWGATEVMVEEGGEAAAAPAPTPADIDSQSLEAAQTHAKARFIVADQAPVEELRRQCVLVYARRFCEGWRPLSPPPESCPLAVAPPAAPSLTALTSTDNGLASLPDIYFRINEALDDPACTASRLADVISKDTGMSARLLRLVNSPLLSRGHAVDTLSRGVLILGVREIRQLALAISVMSVFKDVRSGRFPVAEFWKHSLACGVFARLLALRLNHRDLERFFVAGMLHDVGRLVMLRLASGEIERAVDMAFERRMPLRDAEREVFGFDHCDVARELLGRWQLPATLAGMIAAHHAPAQAEAPLDAAIINAADAMAVALEYGCNGEFVFTGPAQGAWESLGLPESVLAVVISQAQRQIDDIFAAFLE